MPLDEIEAVEYIDPHRDGLKQIRRTRIRACTVPQPSILAACSISEEMEVKVPRSSHMAKA